jgi:aspartate kinase
MVILSMVGKQMRNMVGIAGRMFTTLAHGNVNIEMISQGANEINISCVIDGRDAIKALNLIHQSCLQIKPEVLKGRGQYLFHLLFALISLTRALPLGSYSVGPWLF